MCSRESRRLGDTLVGIAVGLLLISAVWASTIFV